LLQAYVVEKMANALNERFVATGLDRVVPKKANALHTVGEKIDSWRRIGSMFLGVSREPLQGVVNRADILGVVGGTGSSYPVELSGVGNDGPHHEVSELSERWANTPHPAVSEEREADPSV